MQESFQRDARHLSEADVYIADLIPRLRADQLRTLLSVTLYVLPLLTLITLGIFSGGNFANVDMGPFVPILAIAAGSYAAQKILDHVKHFQLAVCCYILGFLLCMTLFMRYGISAQFAEARNAAPFLLTLVAALAGVFLSPAQALLVTATSVIWCVTSALFFGWTFYDAIAIVFTMFATLIANLTAGSLFTMADYTTHSYLLARKRADDFFSANEDLRKALATQDWLNEQLQESNQQLSLRALQLETSSEVSRQATSILYLDVLLPQVARLIQSRFEYYFVGIWLADERKHAALLSAGIRRDGTSLVGAGMHLSYDTPSVVVSVCRSGEYRLVRNVAEAPDYLPQAELPETQSLLVLPLRFGEKTLGALAIASEQLAAFGDEDQLVLQSLADQLAIAIRNARLYGAEQNRRQLAESLEATGRELSSSLDLREIPPRILEQLTAVVPYERGLVLTQDDTSLRAVAMRGFPAEWRAENFDIEIRSGDVFERIVQSREPVLVDDVSEDPGFRMVEGLPLNFSWLGVPLISKDRVIGMISLTRAARGAFDAEDAQLVLAFAGQAAVALENAGLYDEIRRFNEHLEQMVQARTEELNRAYLTLEKMDRKKSDFIDVTAHELRTPLTVIKGYTQILKVSPKISQDSQLASMMAGILNGVERLHTIVNSMLDVAKIDGQSLNLSKRAMYVEEIFARIHESFAEALAERQLTLRIEGIEALPALQADPTLLYKVFDQVIGNAVKYTPDGGQIAVRGKVLTVTGEAPWIEIVVSDTGIGIDSEYHELIFEKFYQMGEVAFHSSGRTKFKGGGPGLGLAIARGIIEAHGGKIWVESAGHDETQFPGSSFYIWLPVAG